MIKAAKPCFSRPAELRTNGLGLSELMFKTQIETSLSCPLAQIILPVNIVFEIFLTLGSEGPGRSQRE